MNGLSNCFFKVLEDEIESKWDNIECKDVYELYFNYLGKVKGRATGEISIGKTTIPDIVIWKSSSKDLKREPPDRAIKIKIYTAEKSEKTVEDAVNRLKTIRATKNTFRGLLIFYNHPSKFGEIKKILEREKDWLDWLILENNSENFVEILRAWLEQNE